MYIKGKPVPVPNHHAIKTYGGMEWSFISAADGGERSASRSNYFTLGTHWMGVWVSFRVGLDAVAKQINYCL